MRSFPLLKGLALAAAGYTTGRAAECECPDGITMVDVQPVEIIYNGQTSTTLITSTW